MTINVDQREIFATWFTPIEGMTPQEIEAECERLAKQNQMATDFLKGDVDSETLLDALEYYGVDPDQYIETVEDNVDAVINGAVQLNPASIIIDGGLYEVY